MSSFPRIRRGDWVARRVRRTATIALAVAVAPLLVGPTAPAASVAFANADLQRTATVPEPLRVQPASFQSNINSGALARTPAVRLDNQRPTRSQTGFHSLFIGHSFFRPIADQMSFHAPNAGFADHTQITVFSGGANGAPQALWDNPTKRAEIQAALDGGDVELFGMTYHPDHPTLEGYRRWIDYALSRNPATTFFVGFPWLTNPGTMDSDTYGVTWSGAYDTIAKNIIDNLRVEYPNVDLFAIPYGQAAVELYSLFESGELPDVDALVSRAGDGIFRDDFGHADTILLDLASLVWLRAIYGVELSSYDWEPNYVLDLKAIADAIMAGHDPRYDAPVRVPLRAAPS
jgi:hypothetical protein